MMEQIRSCPFCGGRGRVSFKDARFAGQNYRGDKKIVYRVQIICNRCASRGKPIRTEPLINPNPYGCAWGPTYDAKSPVCQRQTELFAPYVEAAIRAWNERYADGATA